MQCEDPACTSSLQQAISQTLVASSWQPVAGVGWVETADQWLLALLLRLVAGCWLVGWLVGWVVGRWSLAVGRWSLVVVVASPVGADALLATEGVTVDVAARLTQQPPVLKSVSLT